MSIPLYSHRPVDYTCPFCSLLGGSAHPDLLSQVGDIIHHDDVVTALVASHQVRGNTPNLLVLPNAHYENIFDLPPELGAALYRVAQRVAFALKRAYACDGISTRQHNEPAGSQDVWHYHLHVTPRFTGDRFYDHIYERNFMPAEERATHAARLRTELQ